MNMSFLSLALLTLPSVMFAMESGAAAKEPSWPARALAVWREHTPLLMGAGLGAAVLFQNQIPGGATVASQFGKLAPELQTAAVAGTTFAAAELNAKLLDGKPFGNTSLRDWAAIGGTAVVVVTVGTQLASRFSGK